MEETEKKIEWDEAVVSNFISFNDGETKSIKITNWFTYQNERFGDIRPAFKAKVLEENGNEVTNENYCWDTTSQPAMRALMPILKNKNSDSTVELKVTRIGDRSDTRYKIEEVN